jgi:hypothetical protein
VGSSACLKAGNRWGRPQGPVHRKGGRRGLQQPGAELGRQTKTTICKMRGRKERALMRGFC